VGKTPPVTLRTILSGGGVIRNTAPGEGLREIAARILLLFRSLLWRSLVNKLTLVVALAALTTLSACKKTGEGQYEVQKPVIGTETDTVNTPSVETGTVKDTIEVTRPTVEVKKPKE
jgi:hypothetical protein